MSERLSSLLGSTPCGCGTCCRVGTERVRLGDDVAGALLAELDGRRAIVFGDPRTLAACPLVPDPGSRVVDLEIAGTPLHADEEAVARALEHLVAAPEAVPVAVGSGTINDVVKAAARGAGRRYVAVASAASMNGYTSAIAAITRGGLKGTLPSTPPIAVLASPRVLASAPRRLARSGLADLLGKPVSTADWRLSHLVWNEPYCPAPADLAAEAVDRAAAVARGIAEGEPAATRALFEALLISGISMAVAGSSSPASGGEHLISHYLDMTAAMAPDGPRAPALHGEQVGVATRICTRLYDALLGLGEREIDWSRAERVAPEVDDLPGLLSRAPWIDDDLRATILQEGQRKLRRLGKAKARVAALRACWERLREALNDDVETARSYLDVLPTTGAPLSGADIGVGNREMRAAFHLARWIRDRYTVLDVAGDLGLLEEVEEETLASTF